MFLATFIICLREGLEASLIVGILAAFLKRAGISLKWLIIATVAAVAVSIAVGLGLMFAEQALPQAQQEAMETIIGIIAVCFVTTMILWMNSTSRSIKGKLEQSASESLSRGGERAMAFMAFLSVVKEGFETAVFLLAVFQSTSGSPVEGALGSLIGLALAIVIGYLIYYGGSHFNIKIFFQVTGPFLIAVAAGFVLNAFRTGHEAGWVNIGQQQIFDFSAVISNNSVVGALITGVFSIPADPRLIEVIGWFAYFIPIMIIYCWPEKHSFSPKKRMKVEFGFAAVLAVCAIALFAFFPRTEPTAGDTRPVESATGAVESVQLISVVSDQATIETHGSGGEQQITLSKVSEGASHGIELTQWEGKVDVDVSGDNLPSNLTLNELLQLNGGQLPAGISLERTRGPFDATYSETITYSARTSGDDSLLRADAADSLYANLTGGGISGTKTVELHGNASSDTWAVSDDESEAAEEALEQSYLDYEESSLYWAWIPTGLAGIAVWLVIAGLYNRRKDAEGADGAAKPEGSHAQAATA